jgi:hypothetical protein
MPRLLLLRLLVLAVEEPGAQDKPAQLQPMVASEVMVEHGIPMLYLRLLLQEPALRLWLVLAVLAVTAQQATAWPEVLEQTVELPSLLPNTIQVPKTRLLLVMSILFTLRPPEKKTILV